LIIELGKSWEHKEGGTLTQIVVDSVEFWTEVLHAPSPVIDWIENGYKLPLKYMPSPLEKCNHRSAMDHQTFVDDSVQELLKYRYIRGTQQKPGSLSVVANCEGKLRLVLDRLLQI